MRCLISLLAVSCLIVSPGCKDEDLQGCVDAVLAGPTPIAEARDRRFDGKVSSRSAQCRGGDRAVKGNPLPWLDWPNYYGTGDQTSKAPSELANRHGIGSALIDIERERVELIKFNLFDNSGTFREYVVGRQNTEGPAIKVFPAMRLPPQHPNYADVGGTGNQVCKGELIRARTLTGICNDLFNPLMGSKGTLFARNVEFEETFPESGLEETTRNRHGNRLSLMVPDPQVISRKLFTRVQSDPAACADGQGTPGFTKDAHCDYKKAPFFNVIAAFWIQFMTHDWFSHLEEGHNAPEFVATGCTSQKVNDVETPLTPAQASQLGCRPGDVIDKSFVADDSAPPTFSHEGRNYLMRAPKTFRNNTTAWWDASQLYGYDETSRIRVKRDPADPARLLMVVRRRQNQRGRSSRLPAAAVGQRPQASGLGRPGSRGISRQLDRRLELPP